MQACEKTISIIIIIIYDRHRHATQQNKKRRNKHQTSISVDLFSCMEKCKYLAKCWCMKNVLNHCLFLWWFYVWGMENEWMLDYSKRRIVHGKHDPQPSSICLHKFCLEKPNIPFMIIAQGMRLKMHKLSKQAKISWRTRASAERRKWHIVERKAREWHTANFALLYTSFLVMEMIWWCNVITTAYKTKWHTFLETTIAFYEVLSLCTHETQTVQHTYMQALACGSLAIVCYTAKCISHATL